ncbi:MAG: TonB-dependent receptor, partial [Pseudomonadota bacterium]|nr:TonB-dependent receptor [Pseudomonadota bacterium]
MNRVKPRFNDFGVNASVEAGNYNSRQLKVRLNVPLIEDELALKVGVIDRSRDGFYMNENIGGTAGDVDFRSITAALRWAPSDIFEATLTYDNIDDTSQIPPQDPRYDGSNPFITLSDKREPTTYDVDQVGIRATLELSDNVTLHSITGWHDGADGVNQDFDGAGVDGLAIPFAQLHTLREQQFEVLTQEVRVTGSFNDNLDFMVGYYYYDSELDFKQRTNNILQLPAAVLGLTGVPCAGIPAIGLILPFRANPTVGDVFCQFPNAKSTQLSAQDVVSDAFFGSITWRPNDALEIMLGMRYIEEETSAQTAYYDHSTGTFDTGGVESEHDFSGLPSVLSPNGYDSGDYWEDTIFTTSISYAFTDSNRVYASYSEGFRSGGFSIRSARAASEAPFDPETADQVEIGSKNELLDGKLHLNIAYYSIDRVGGQFSSIISLPPGSIPGTTTIINNGGTSTTDGWELESRWMINENFTLLLNYGSLNADNGTVSIACEFLDGCVSSVPGGAPDPIGTIRTLGGNSDSRQPESTFAVNL